MAVASLPDSRAAFTRRARLLLCPRYALPRLPPTMTTATSLKRPPENTTEAQATAIPAAVAPGSAPDQSPEPAHAEAVTAFCNRILHGDCRDTLSHLPEASIDLVFADPPYFLQLTKSLYRPDRSRVDGVTAAWDRYAGFADYDAFTAEWLAAVRRVLKPAATLWVSGTYHNIFRIGKIMQDLGFWLLNDVIWIKHNPMPNFLGRRLTNAHETILWAAKSKEARYYFDYHTAKGFNDGLQLRSDWYLPICGGKERLRDKYGKTSHPTQKPLALLSRILLCASTAGAVVLDPFSGSGTTAVAAKRLRRRFIGVEREQSYVRLARDRLLQVTPLAECDLLPEAAVIKPKARVPFSYLVDRQWLKAGDRLFNRSRSVTAHITANGQLRMIVANDKQLIGAVGSIHKLAGLARGLDRCNGWEYWFFVPDDEPGQEMVTIDHLRQRALRLQTARQTFSVA